MINISAKTTQKFGSFVQNESTTTVSHPCFATMQFCSIELPVFSQFSVHSCWQQHCGHIDSHSLYKNKLSYFSLLITLSQESKCWHRAYQCGQPRTHWSCRQHDVAIGTDRRLHGAALHTTNTRVPSGGRSRIHGKTRDILLTKITGFWEEINKLQVIIRLLTSLKIISLKRRSLVYRGDY